MNRPAKLGRRRFFTTTMWTRAKRCTNGLGALDLRKPTRLGVHFCTCQDGGFGVVGDAGVGPHRTTASETLLRVSGCDLFWVLQNKRRLMGMRAQGLNESFESLWVEWFCLACFENRRLGAVGTRNGMKYNWSHCIGWTAHVRPFNRLKCSYYRVSTFAQVDTWRGVDLGMPSQGFLA